MSRFLRVVGLAALALLLGASPTTFRPAPAPDFDARLAAALDEGRIDRPHAALYRLFALKAPDRLPAEFRADRPEGAVGRVEAGAALPWSQRCGTTTLRGLRAALAELPDADRAEADGLLPVPQSAGRAQRVAGKTVTHQLPFWILTTNFSIEWGADLTDADGSNAGHPTDADGNGVPDVVDRWASYFEASYQAEVVDRGYSVAALVDQYIPVYLGNSAAGSTLDDIGIGVYAFTNIDQFVYVLVNNDFRFVPANEDPEGRIPGAMKVTAAHEFHHVLQFLMPLPTTWDDNEDDWWLEASATWMEDEVFDQVNDYFQYFGGKDGWASLMATGLPVRSDSAAYTTKAYGNVIFAKYLSEHLGGAARLKDVWDLIAGGRRILFDESAAPAVTNGALNRFAVASGFSGVGALWLGFAGANATMDYREGDAYGAVPIRATSLTTGASSPSVPLYLGAQYLASAAGTGAGVTVDLTGNPATSWGLAFAIKRPAGYAVVLGEESPVGAPSLALAAFEAGATLWAAPSYLTPQLPPAGLAPPPPPPNGYTSAAVAFGPAGNPPGPVGALSVTEPVNAGGLDVAWSAPTSGRPAAGTVVRWKRQTDAVFDSRTLFGPITRAELRGLEGNAMYDVEVFAYGSAGEEGAASSATGTAKATVATPTPAVAYTEKHLTSSTGGGGGGGGGGFLRALGW